MKFGLLGKVLGHSYSPQIHAELGDYKYELFEREIDKIGELIKNPEIKGFNVTIPYKEEVMKYCDIISDRAKEIGCVNTVFKKDSGEVLGDNTDYYGFEYILDSRAIEVKNKKVIILGDGATSKTAFAVLKNKGGEAVKLSRKTSPLLSDIKDYKDANIIVNTTPVGMYPNNLETIVDLDIFNNLEAVVDVIYNPSRTKLLLDAMNAGLKYSDGLPMLVGQAIAASEIFQDKKIDDTITENIINKIRSETMNIVLIGMPGSGKSTIGSKLALETSKTLIDTDLEIENKEGMSIPHIFDKYGENYFRELESKVLIEFGKENGLVIATGGGIVTREQNYEPLKQNGRIYFLKRDLEKLERSGRPLSAGLNAVEELWSKREKLYNNFADVTIENNSIYETTEKILEDYNENSSY